MNDLVGSGFRLRNYAETFSFFFGFCKKFIHRNDVETVFFAVLKDRFFVRGLALRVDADVIFGNDDIDDLSRSGAGVDFLDDLRETFAVLSGSERNEHDREISTCRDILTAADTADDPAGSADGVDVEVSVNFESRKNRDVKHVDCTFLVCDRSVETGRNRNMERIHEKRFDNFFARLEKLAVENMAQRPFFKHFDVHRSDSADSEVRRDVVFLQVLSDVVENDETSAASYLESETVFHDTGSLHDVSDVLGDLRIELVGADLLEIERSRADTLGKSGFFHRNDEIGEFHRYLSRDKSLFRNRSGEKAGIICIFRIGSS